MTSYNATADTLDHLVRLVFKARPSWDSTIVKLVLLSHAGQVDGTDLAIAALRAAKDEKLPSPKAIGWRGPHWDGLGTCPPAIKSSPERCATCGKPEPSCYSQRFGDDDHSFETVAQLAARLAEERGR